MVFQRITYIAVVIQCVIILCHGLCDQRPHGDLKCCSKKDSQCFVRLQSNRTLDREARICYCDRYCKFTNDCCEDIDKVLKLCNQPLDCKVSDWQAWSKCSRKCGFGTMTRTRKVLQYPENGGKQCPALKQTRGCSSNLICDKKQYATAMILPISFRRPKFGKYIYENILPAEKKLPNEQYETKTSPTYSYCVHYKVTFKRASCEKTWASKLESHVPVCTECQSRVMDGGHCRGEGKVGIRTRWKALGLERCHGDWIRLGPIIPNCTCQEKQFSNFVFV